MKDSALNVERLVAEHGRVEELDLDDEFQAHLTERATYEKHVVTLAEVLEVHLRQPMYFENHGEGRRAPIIMVGPTDAGRFLCVPLEPTGRKGVWRPVTAFQANTHHRQSYEGDLSNGGAPGGQGK